MKKIRLLQVAPTLRCGGAERMVVNLMTHLDRRRYQVGAIILGRPEGGALERRLSDEGFQLWYLGKDAAFDLKVPFRIRNIVRQFRPHVVHSHLCLHYVFPALAGYAAARHVETVHLPGDTKHSQVMLPLTRLALRRGVIPVGVSGEVAHWVKRVCGVEDCLVIPNGIPVADYQRLVASRKLCRFEQGLRDDDVAFVCVARLEKQKNHAMLLEAFARALPAEPRAHLWLVGDGGCRNALELRAAELRLDGRVRFLGQRSDVPRILGAADTFVLASHNEGNPLALMEAMAAGLPVVATSVGGVPELVVDQRSGLLTAPGDCDGLASAMRRLFRDAELRRMMAACSVERAVHAFSAFRMAEAYMNLYKHVVSDDPAMVARRGMAVASPFPN
jgi:glycosyltransferase involved in cell wall biosynthesis